MKTVITIILTFTMIVVGIALLTRYLGYSLSCRACGGIQGVRVTSWWRSPAKNRAVDGVLGSLHLVGWAIDLTPVSPEVEALARTRFPFVLNEGDHLHAAVFGG